jgi:hypothetical protein
VIQYGADFETVMGGARPGVWLAETIRHGQDHLLKLTWLRDGQILDGQPTNKTIPESWEPDPTFYDVFLAESGVGGVFTQEGWDILTELIYGSEEQIGTEYEPAVEQANRGADDNGELVMEDEPTDVHDKEHVDDTMDASDQKGEDEKGEDICIAMGGVGTFFAI